MKSFHGRRVRGVAVLSLMGLVLLLTGSSLAQDAHTTTVFSGVKVNAGTVTHSKQGGKNSQCKDPPVARPS